MPNNEYPAEYRLWHSSRKCYVTVWLKYPLGNYQPASEIQGTGAWAGTHLLSKYLSMTKSDSLEQSEAPIDNVNQPNHYAVLDDIEAIHLIRAALSDEGWRGYCLGNIMKYRLRAGNKDDVNQDLAKADKYKELYEELK